MAGLVPTPRQMLLALAILVLVVRPAAAQERELAQVDDDLAAAAVKLRALTDHKLAEATARGLRSFAARLNDAEVMFILGDYTRSALMLYEMLREPHASEQVNYDKALRYLAESFFQQQNDRLAATYFKEMIQRPDVSYSTEAAQRLIEIADRTQDWSGLTGLIENFRHRGGLPPEVAYRYARSLLMRGRSEDAQRMAAEVPASHPIGLKSAYVQAVARLESGDVDGARDMFEQISQDALDANRLSDDAPQVHDLAALDLGRVLIEQGNYEKGLAQYQKIEHTSGKFEDALYELTWLYVRSGQHATGEEERFAAYNQAVDRLEILLLEPSNAGLVPDASLLLANVQLNLGRYQSAERAFNEVVARYTPMRDNMDAVQRTNPDLAHVFLPGLQLSKSVAGVIPGSSESLLPPLANLYARDEAGLQRAVSITHDLDDSAASLEEADKLLQKIAGSIKMQNAANFSYTLQDTQNRALELQNNLISMTERLLSVQRSLIAPTLSPVAAQQLQAVLAERAEIEPRYRSLPQRREDYEVRDSEVKDALARMQRDAYRVKFAIQEQQQQIAALLSWYTDHPNSFNAESTEQFQARLGRESTTLRDLESTRQDLNTEIDTQRSMSGVMSTEQGQEEDLRARYAASLEQERVLLAQGVSGVGDKSRNLMLRVDKDREVIVGFHNELEIFRKSMSDAVHVQMERSQVDVSSLQEAISNEHKSLEEIRGDAGDAIQAVAGIAMKDVRGKFYEIVLRGDVGVVDVAWQIKEEQTHQVNRQVSRQHEEMQNLDNEFKDVMTKD